VRDLERRAWCKPLRRARGVVTDVLARRAVAQHERPIESREMSTQAGSGGLHGEGVS